jgi:uncharacterized membrane protein YeiH
MVAGFDPNLILALNLAGTFAFGLAGGLAAVRARLDLLGVVVIAFVVALAGGVIRDLLIGVPPATFRDGRYLVAAGAAGIVSFFARPALERVDRGVTFFDALGLGVFCVTGASAATIALGRPSRSFWARSPGWAAGWSATCCCGRSPASCGGSSTRCPRCSAPASSSPLTGPAA